METNTNNSPILLVYCTHFQPSEDEINPLEIWHALVQKRRFIFLVTLAVTLTATAFAFFSPLVYKAEIFLLPPLSKDIQALNVHDLNVQSSESIYNLFVRNLHARAFRRQLFDEQNLVAHFAPERDQATRIEDVFEGFNKSLTVSRNIEKNGEEDFVTVSFEVGDAVLAAKVLNNFINLVNAETVSALVLGVEKKLNKLKQGLRDQIAGKRLMAQRHRNDRILELDEAAAIAEALGIVENTVPAVMTGLTQKSTVAVTHSQPLYMRGTKALRAEANILRQRKTDEPFIKGLRALQEQLVLLEKITLDRESIAAVTIDQWAFPPKTPIKPKRLLIMTIGFILGFMLSIFLVFFLNSLEQQRELEPRPAPVR
jgi:chain length determinant protein (polysaccharide antigen chain regulator)